MSAHKGQVEKHEIASESPDNLITIEEDQIKSGKPIALQDRVLMEWQGLTYDVPVSKKSLNDNVGPQKYVQPLLRHPK